MRKKGAINLSINMIIILIIAIIILGFALSFITDLFSKAEKQIWDQFPDTQIPVNSENPIGIPENFKIDSGDERSMSMQVFNTQDSAVGTQVTSGPEGTTITSPEIQCSSGSQITISRAQPNVEIPSGEKKKVAVVIKAGAQLTNNDICTITFKPVGDADGSGEGLSQTFFVKTG